jgi:O-antigen/teichoic acid export membrane protein
VQGVLALVSGVCALVAAWVSWQLGWDVTLLLIVLAPTVVAWEMQEFLRRVLYTEGRAGAALINDSISYGGQAAGAVALGVTGHASGLAVLIVMGVSSAVAALVGAVQVGPSLRGAWTWEAVHENWRYGKWLAASELTGNWLGDQLYVFLAIPILGFSAAGVLKAMQLLFGPIRLVIMAVNTMTPIRAVKALERGGARAFRQEYARVLLVVVPIIVAYAAVAILFAPQLLSLAYGATYLAYAQVFQIGALCMLAGSAVIVTSSILRALDATRAIFYGRLIGGIFGVALAWPVIYWLGLNGMMFALLLGSLFTLALLLHLTRQSMPRSAQPGASAISPLEARP